MRHWLPLAAAGLAVIAVVLYEGGRIRTQDHAYRVRAIFDNAEALAPGEDVTVAGSVIGTITSLDVTPDYKAVVNLRIDDRQFVPFRADASCVIRSEGVLAVKYVDCDPGRSPAPALPAINSGLGQGSHLLSVAHTSSPVDIDLVTDVMRDPTGEQLAILVDELGTGLAARGSDLNAVIHRADPALGQTDQVVQVLARQNRVLAGLASNADRVLTPLAAARTAIAQFVVGADRTGQATADHSGALAVSIARLPGFLTQLRSLMGQLGSLTDQGIPVLSELRAAAPGLDSSITQLAPFARTGTPALRSLGALAQRGGPDLVRSSGLVSDLAALARTLRPDAGHLAAVTTSFASNAGIEHFMQLLFYGTNSVNGFDASGHYARVEPISGTCSQYTAYGWLGCSSQFNNASAKHITAGPGDPALHLLLGYLLG
jgi:phospholipid/cholesterol/gamma-HCH transport system substrate-binding protein